MRKSAIVSFNKVNIIKYFSNNRTILLLCLMFVVGVAVGTFTFFSSSTVQSFSRSFIEEYITFRVSSSFLNILFFSLVSYLISMMVAFLCGTSLMGFVLLPALAIFHGFAYAGISAAMYSDFALKGVAFNALVFLPPTLIFLITFLFAARESLGFSFIIAKLTLPKSLPMNLFTDFKNYCGRYLLLSCALVLSSLVDAVVSRAFIHFFDFVF